MMIGHIIDGLQKYWPCVVSTLIILFLASQKYHHGLHRYPGPWLAQYTNFWRLYRTWIWRQIEQDHQDLHEKYGDIVRIGPNTLSFADPSAIKDIYALNKGFIKSSYYPVSTATSRGHTVYSLFSMRDEDFHAQLKRCVNGAFTMPSMLHYEPLVDSTIEAFLEQTQTLYTGAHRKPCNLSRWFQFFAFDTIGEITWSKRLGFVDKNADTDGIIAAANAFVDYASVMGQAPWLDRLWAKNPVYMVLSRLGLWPSRAASPIVRFALARQAEHEARLTSEPASAKDDSTKGADLLTYFLSARTQHPALLTNTRILGLAVSLIVAGSDTTAITLAALFNYLLRHPASYARLRAEADTLLPPSSPRAARIPLAIARRAPFLRACIAETMRLHPAVGMLLEREVPAGGARISGTWVAGGTVVGVNAWVAQRDGRVFGQDARAFRPERWLEASGARARAMRAAMMEFGRGARACIGREVSLLEMYKVVPALLRRFDLDLVDPMRPVRRECAFFVRVLDLDVLFRERGMDELVARDEGKGGGAGFT